MTTDQIQKNLSIIQTELDKEVSSNNIVEVEEKLMNLATYMGLSAECMRHTKANILDKQKQLSDFVIKNTQLSATNLKFVLEGKMKDELTLHMYAERLNAALAHCSDSLLSILSKYKEELRVSRYATH